MGPDGAVTYDELVEHCARMIVAGRLDNDKVTGAVRLVASAYGMDYGDSVRDVCAVARGLIGH